MGDTRKRYIKEIKQRMKELNNHQNENDIAGDHYGWNKIDIAKPFIIVLGYRGVGKTVYIDGMKSYNPNMQYVEEQDIHRIDIRVVKLAHKIIEIKEVNLNERY